MAITFVIVVLAWAVVFGITILSDLDGFKAGVRAIFRLYITDLWAITVGLMPSIWVLSLVIRNWSEKDSQPLFGLAGTALIFASQLLGMVRASIHILSTEARASSRLRRAGWFVIGGLYGLCLLIIPAFLGVLSVLLLNR